MDTDIYERYERLFKLVDEHNRLNNKDFLTICPAIKGENYVEGGLMFVGRSINGWCPLRESMYDGEGIKSRIKRCEKCTLDWVVGQNTWNHCIESGCPYANRNKESVDGRNKTTPFWQMVKYICKRNGIEDDWYKKIVWTNLYKASYEDGGNPIGFYKDQVEICNYLLIKEIERYNPKQVYFITEHNRKKPTRSNRTWFCESYRDKDIHFKKVYNFLREKIEKKDIEVFVMTRPEFQNKDLIWDNKEEL